MKKPYSYFINPFLVIGVKSFRKAVKLSKKTYIALQARSGDAFYAAQLAIYEPLHLALIDAYTTWAAQGGIQKGATLTFDQLLKLLPKKMDAFASTIKSIDAPNFEKGSPNYIAILPQGMKPFGTNKSIQVRMDALAAVKKALASFGDMAPVSAIFDPYLVQLTKAQNTQGINKTNTGSDSDELKKLVIEAMRGLYAFMGAGITNFSDDATVLDKMFAMQVLRNHRQVKFTGALAPAEVHNIMQHTFDDFDELILTAKDVKLSFYLALNAFDGPASYTLIDVPANTTKTIDASEFTKTATNAYLCVVNTDAVLAGSFIVKL